MSFETVEQQTVWCIHFENMKLCKGLLLGKETNRDEPWLYVRMEGAAITKIEYIIDKNVFYSEEAANRALFKASLKGDQRKANKDIRDT